MRAESGDSHLAIALSAAVPLWVAEMRASGGPTDKDREDARGLTDDLAARGDVLLYGSKRKGEAAALFNRLAHAVAVLSFSPGGIRLFGEHWDAAELWGRGRR